MRCWILAGLVALAVALPACRPKTIALPPTAFGPHYPDFIEPTVPPAMISTTVSGAQTRAWQFLQAGDLKSAEREANAALKSVPDFIPAATTLAYVDLARKDWRGAIGRFDRALAGDAAYAPALAGKGQALALLNRDEEAVSVFETALRSDPALPDVPRRLDVVRLRLSQKSIAAARQAAKAGKFVEAMDSYRAAIVRSPESAFLYRELALIERDHDGGDAALEDFRRATTLDPTDMASFVDLAAMLDARNEFSSALDAYGAAIALDPDPTLVSRRDALRLRAEVARLPPEYRAIASAPQITRGDLAALVGFRLQRLLAGVRPRDVGVITDIRGHWADRWILEVSRAGIMDPFANHTFQPRALVRRVDFAQVIARVLTRVAAVSPEVATRWQSARGRFPDLAPSHAAYLAVSAAVASGAMLTVTDGAFQPSAVISGAEATDAIVRVLSLAGLGASRP